MDDKSDGEEETMEEQFTELNTSTFSHFENLPTELTQKILEKIPIVSLFCFKFTSKSFSEIVKNQDLAHKVFSNAAMSNPLIFISCNSSIYFMDADSSKVSKSTYLGKFKKMKIPFTLPNFYTVGSCHGYLCLTNSSTGTLSPYNDLTFIWNPLTRHFVELPSLGWRVCEPFGFGCHPLTKEHKVVKLYDVGDQQHMQIFTLGKDNHWRTLKAPSNVSIRYLKFKKSRDRSICVNGSIHWLARKNGENASILAFDLATEEIKEDQACENTSLNHVCLMEIRGCLAMVSLESSRNELRIWVMDRDSWSLRFAIRNFGWRLAEQIEMKEKKKEIPVNRWGFSPVPRHAICLLEEDLLLMRFELGGILCYDFRNDRFLDFEVGGLPNQSAIANKYEAAVLKGSFIRLK